MGAETTHVPVMQGQATHTACWARASTVTCARAETLILSLLFQDISSELWCSTQKNVTGEHRESETEGAHQGGQREKSILTIKSRVSPRDSSETLWFSISRDQHSLTKQGSQWTRLCKAGGVQAERRGEAVYVMQNLVSHSPLCGDDCLKCAAQGTSSILSLVIEWCLTPIKVMWDWYSLPCLSLIQLSNGEGGEEINHLKQSA